MQFQIKSQLRDSSTLPVPTSLYSRIALIVLVTFFFLCTYASAQNVQYTNNSVDLGMRNSQRVNPSTRAVELQIPLGNYRGRAGLDVPVTLLYSSKVWNVEFQGYNVGAPPPHEPQPFTIVTANYSKHSVAGWSSTVGFPVLDFHPGDNIYDSSGSPNVSGNCTAGCYKVDRMLVWMPDGSGHELRASDQPRLTTAPVPDDYYSVDGSRMHYKASITTLFLPDGSQYQFPNKYIDRNGNTLTWSGGWHDTLDRTINNPLPFSQGSGPFSPTDQTYSVPGVGNTLITYTLKWRYLADSLTTLEPTRYIADGGCPPGQGAYTPYLFTSDSGSRTCMGNAGVSFNPVVLSQIVLPTGRSYTFTYDIFGAINKIVLPTGGYERFVYDYIGAVTSPLNFKFVYAQANRGVTQHFVSATGLAGDEVQWLYGGSGNFVSMTAPDGSRSERYLHIDGVSGWGYSADSSRAGQAYDERIFSASNQMLRRKLTQWVTTPSNATGNPSGTQSANRNPRIVREVEFLLDTGGGPALSKSKTYTYDTTFQYDVGLEKTAANEYDYFPVDQNTAQTLDIGSLATIPNGTPLRTTEYDYLTSNSNYRSRNLLGLVTATRIKDGNGAVVAQTNNTYDEAAFPLLTYTSVLGWTDPATAYRGNVTTVTSWLNFNGVSLSTFPQGQNLAVHTQYDQCGSARKIWDARDTSLTNPTQIDYSSTYQRAYPTTQTSPDPDGSGPLASLVTSMEYDFSTGLITATVDANSQRTTFAYNDPLNRLKQIVHAETDVTAKSQTSYDYNDAARSLTITSDRDNYNDNILKLVMLYDEMGRPRETQQFEGPSSYISVQQQYDNMNRANKRSNPFRPLQNETLTWTTKQFDELGRLFRITTPDNAVASTSYSGNVVTVTEQTGKQRKSVTDALGRTIQIFEAPNDPSFNYLTEYQYDALDELVKVTQGTQQRFYMFDSLKRLIRSTNPEQGINSSLNLSDPVVPHSTWSTGFQYDNDGNLTQKTDPRGVVSTFTYDSLNRALTTAYTNDPAATPSVTYAYDGAVNGKGLLYQSQTSATSQTTIDSYDALGRPSVERQQFYVSGVWGQSYTTHRGYNRAGGVISETYPSDRVVSYSYDDAGRTLSFSGTIGDGNARTFSSEMMYSPFGSLAKEKFGTNTSIYNKLFYTSRGQLAEIRESTSYTGPTDTNWNRGAIINHYSDLCWGMCSGSSMTDNNGNLKKQDVYIPNDDQISGYTLRTQQYDYDSVNRLNWAREIKDGVEQWKQQFAYDRWGNRTINTSTTYGAGINNKPFNVDVATNRLTVPAGQSGAMNYDPAGNLTTDSYTGTGTGERIYDAENRMVQAWGNSQWQYYTYNAYGQRVRRKVNNAETWQVFGFDGELLAEYPAGGATNNPNKEYGYRNGQLLINADAGNGSAAPTFADDFNDNSLNANSWTVYYPGISPIVSETSQQLQIALSPNTAAYNGVYSNSTYNLTGKMVQVESAQAVSQAGWCENFLEVELDANNYFMIQVGAGNMLFRSRVNGVNDQTLIAFDGVANRFWRIRHDQSANLIYFETSADSSVWLTRKTVTPGFALTALRFDLLAGAYGTGNSSPGAAKYDNFKLLASTGSNSLTVPNGGFESPVLGTGNWQYAPTSGSWSFANGGGISGTNSAFTGTPSAAPEGVQIAFIQAYGTISQSISGFLSNTSYVITFKAIQRTNCCNTGGQDIGVYVDDVLVGSFHPSASAYVEYSTPSFSASTGAHTVKFAGLNPLGGDHTAFIDNVRITGSPRPGNGIEWLLTDQLGTPRMVFDESGSLTNVKRHDYLPFGEELPGGTNASPGPGGRKPSQGYGCDPSDANCSLDRVRQQFTAEERDVETGLDYFHARYYGSVQGRFTSVDPIAGRSLNPQTLNRYSYAKNNPLRYTDPSGLSPQDPKCPDCINKDDNTNDVVKINSAKPAWYKRAWNGIKKWFSDTGKIVGQQAMVETSMDLTVTSKVEEGVVKVAPIAREIMESNPELMGGRLGVEWESFDALTVEMVEEESTLLIEETNAAAGIFPVLKGQAGVDRAVAEYEAEGGTVLGREITIDTSAARTRIDFVGRNKSGQLEFVEVKNGPNAGLTYNQQVAFPKIRTEGGIPRGGNAAKAGFTPGQPLPPTPVKVVHYK